MELHERIAYYRKRLRLSQEFVAEAVGMNKHAISLLEKGKREVKAQEAGKLACLFGVTTDELLYGTPADSEAQFAHLFKGLHPRDKEEIMMLLRFKSNLRHNTISSLMPLK